MEHMGHVRSDPAASSAKPDVQVLKNLRERFVPR